MFSDRADAGRQLAGRLAHLRGDDVVVVGLPRGGVPVAAEVADALGAPLDVVLVGKVRVPFHPELAMGAVGEGDVRIVNDDVVRAVGIPEHEFVAAAHRVHQELEQRSRRYRGHHPPIALDGRTVIIVDDGIASGATMRAACQVARAEGARRIVVAVPVSPPGVAWRLRDVADEVVSVVAPARLRDVGGWYGDFSPVADAEVTRLLERDWFLGHRAVTPRWSGARSA